jgi:hypothetical protein
MKKMFLDIETIPAEKEKHAILKEIHQRKVDKGKPIGSFEEFVEGTGLDGAFGRIACISFAFDDEKVETLYGDEKEMLKKFWKAAERADLFIGFNLMDFDLRFIYQRSILFGVKPSKELNFARYRNSPIYDIMYEWSKWNSQNKISLDTLAKAMGLPSSKGGEVEGSNVGKAYEEGKIAKICEYCEKDVELTRKIYKRMIFEDTKEEVNEELF